MISKVYQPSNDEFIKLVEESYSFAECLRKLDLTPRGGSSSKLLKQRIKELGCSTEHFSAQKSGAYRRYKTEEILVENSQYLHADRIKKRLIDEGLMKDECAICGLGSIWIDKPITLHLDHINGKHNDNRIENLRILCPNCHSQTETYSGRNIGE